MSVIGKFYDEANDRIVYPKERANEALSVAREALRDALGTAFPKLAVDKREVLFGAIEALALAYAAAAAVEHQEDSDFHPWRE